MDLFRESAAGQVIRYITKNKYLQYPEEKGDFHWAPLEAMLAQDDKVANISGTSNDGTPSEKLADKDLDADDDSADDNPDPTPLARIPTAIENEVNRIRTNASHRADLERAGTFEKTKSIALAPTKTSDGTILVDWYTTDDVANPQNWAKDKKLFVVLQLCLYSLAVYGASSMYVPGEEGVMKQFHVGNAAAAMGLAIYVIGYGVGPLLWAPLSEIASIGRNWVYVPTFILFVILSIPTAVVDNYAGLLVLRFLTGFFGSPCLANGGGTMGDLFNFIELPVWLSAWTVACFWGPALGPIISGFAVQAKGWRWGLWEIVWLTAPILIVFVFFYPETSADNILRRRAQRLRKLTGRDNIKSQSEIKQAKMKTSEVFWDAIIKPTEIMVKDPAVFFTNVYTSLTYGIYYSFFEVFPLVYVPYYHFNLGEVGLCFLTIGVGCLLGVSSFLIYQFKYLIPDIMKNGMRQPEHRLVPALFGVILLPVGYFMFGWTARESIHWIVPLIGVTILVAANFLIFQSVFIYLPLSYPQYAASLFAANDLSRSMFAAACILFSRPMFINLGIGGGVSLLAGLSCVGVFGMFYLWRYGGWLRSKSTFAAH